MIQSVARSTGLLAMRRQVRTVLAAAAAAVLAGCSLIPTYERPDAPVAAQWPALEAEASRDAGARAAADVPWQEFVLDERLREIIALTLDSNRDLRVAIKNIEQAQAQYRINRADLAPTVNASVSGSRSAPNTTSTPGSVASNYSAALGINAWELDFFGRVRSLSQSALSRYLATEEARKAAQISMIGAVSSTWLSLQANSELLALAERTLATREQSLSLTKLRMDVGASSALDMRQAESLTATAKAAVAQQRRMRAQDINALTLLVGQTLPENLLPPVPSVAVDRPSNDASQSTPVTPIGNTLSRFASVHVGLPSGVLLRRPDIRAAEQQLVAANANIGAARANFFPRITLTGMFGRSSHELDDLFGSGTLRVWSFLPQISLPIFDMGRNIATLDASKAGRDIAVAQYEKAIQTAFREVADALAGRATLGEQLAALEAQATANRESYRLADLRYRNGIASYLYLLDAQRALFASEQALTQTRLLERLNQVELYKALGGGWSDPGAVPVAEKDGAAAQ